VLVVESALTTSPTSSTKLCRRSGSIVRSSTQYLQRGAPSTRWCGASSTTSRPNPAADLFTARLARVAGVSERHLSPLVVAHAGQTPGRLVRQMRPEAAATALVTTDQAVSSIAKATGSAPAKPFGRRSADGSVSRRCSTEGPTVGAPEHVQTHALLRCLWSHDKGIAGVARCPVASDCGQ
jgi:AraC-like DNA-binding protein